MRGGGCASPVAYQGSYVRRRNGSVILLKSPFERSLFFMREDPLHPSLCTTTGDHSTQSLRMVIHDCHFGESHRLNISPRRRLSVTEQQARNRPPRVDRGTTCVAEDKQQATTHRGLTGGTTRLEDERLVRTIASRATRRLVRHVSPETVVG